MQQISIRSQAVLIPAVIWEAAFMEQTTEHGERPDSSDPRECGL